MNTKSRIALLMMILGPVVYFVTSTFLDPASTEEWLHLRQNGGPAWVDTINTLMVALGPGALSLPASLLALPRADTRQQRAPWIAAAVFFIGIQASSLVLVVRMFGGGNFLNQFTLISGSGLVLYAGALWVGMVQSQRQAAS